MAAALALSERARGRSSPNPNVGCIIVKQGRVIGRGWTQAGGRPHAEAVALEQAGETAHGATAYVTLEPCAHDSARGGACSDALILAGVARCVVALEDPDPRTKGAGLARMSAVGMAVDAGLMDAEARRAMSGWLMQQSKGRPFVTLKLATSLDGRIALDSGESRWITGAAARRHAHLERARSSMILVGRGTYDADAPDLNVRLPGLEARAPARALLSTEVAPAGWTALSSPAQVHDLAACDYLLVEGGAKAAAAFLGAGLVDRLIIYRAPILIGKGLAALGDIGLANLGEAHGLWHRSDMRHLGSDILEVYERV